MTFLHLRLDYRDACINALGFAIPLIMLSVTNRRTNSKCRRASHIKISNLKIVRGEGLYKRKIPPPFCTNIYIELTNCTRKVQLFAALVDFCSQGIWKIGNKKKFSIFKVNLDVYIFIYIFKKKQEVCVVFSLRSR